MTLPDAIDPKAQVVAEDSVDAAITVVPFSRKYGVYFADVEVVLSTSTSQTRFGASSLGLAEKLTIARCKSELAERWAAVEWMASGESLVSRGLTDHLPLGVRTAPSRHQRLDATGFCAGPVADTAAVLRHGLLEILERDAVVRFFDDNDGSLLQITSGVPDPIARVAARWGVRIEAFQLTGGGSLSGVSTVLALASRTDGSAGAIGTACRPSMQRALSAACCEALMMYTTARHCSRLASVASGYSGVLWASRNITSLREQFRQRVTGSIADPADGPPAVRPEALISAVERHFGAPATYVQLRTQALQLRTIRAWRVMVDGARSPAEATLDPWPIG
jgi:hypothetical protein